MHSTFWGLFRKYRPAGVCKPPLESLRLMGRAEDNLLHLSGGSMKAALALVSILGLVPMIQAQVAPHTPPTPAAMAQREVARYTTLLTLTPQQVEQATTIFTTEATTASNS